MSPVKKTILITVKAYPSPSHKYGEAACFAGITDEGKWIRLYPVRYRDLALMDRFSKYQWIEIDVEKKKNDPRPESYAPNMDTVVLKEKISSKYWEKRANYIKPLFNHSMCEISELNIKNGISLGAFEPVKESVTISVEKKEDDWTNDQKALLAQTSLFKKNSWDKSPLEKIPYRFKLNYKCGDQSCPTHSQTIIDWEIAQLYRNCRDSSLNEEEVIRKVKEGYLRYAMPDDRKLFIYVGNQVLHPRSFLTLGIFYPPSNCI